MESTFLSSVVLALVALPVSSFCVVGGPEPAQPQSWLELDDAAFAAKYAGMAFGDSLADRERLAWMYFVRVNQLIDDPTNGGMSGSGKVPLWMAWPTDPDTFATREPFQFGAAPRTDIEPSAEKKDLEAGPVQTADPDSSNEEVNRNKISYDYLIQSGLTTQADVATFFKKNDYVNMPVGSIELKASWLQVTDGSPAPPGALTFKFDSAEYWWRGLHIMVKARLLDPETLAKDPLAMFYTEEPSWFWATFEFNENPGVQHVRESLITQRAPLPKAEIAALLEQGGMAGFGFESYAPNGTQIRFTVNGTGETPVILGHTDMEDFAGFPNNGQPRYWTNFQASCHSCHATASYDPQNATFFPFTVPTGALDPGYNLTGTSSTPTMYLGQGFKPLDFMWPIVFQTH